jgi:protein kinase A
MAAAAVKNALHLHRSRDHDKDDQSSHERQDSAMERARDDEKHTIAQWGEQKPPLDPGMVDADPDRKMVGHSSSVLRQEDFELIKTLGTGAQRRHAVWELDADCGQEPLRACGSYGSRMCGTGTRTKYLP